MDKELLNQKIIIEDRYNPELDKLNSENYFSEKLIEAKAYFEKHGFPDFDKILREAAATKNANQLPVYR